MNRTTTVALCGISLALGLLVGSGSMVITFPALHAKALDESSADRLYEELVQRNTPLQQGSELLGKIARLTTNTVVHIQSTRKLKTRGVIEETGSGVIMKSAKANGLFVVTNRHVINGVAEMGDVSVHLHDGRVIHPLEIWKDPATDVAVLRINAPDLQPGRWGDSDRLEIGNMVLAVGSPFGLSQSVTYGIISAKGRRSLRLGDTGSGVFNQDFLQTDAAINPGNSGGPLLNLQGEVVGINTAIASSSGGNEGIAFSIPSSLVRTVMEQLLEYGKVNRAYLGVKLDPRFDSRTAARLKLDRIRGARVMEIYPDTPAARASLQVDDVILTFDGIEVIDENHLINLVSLAGVEKKVKVVLQRAGKRISVEMSLSERPDESARLPEQPGMGTRVQELGLTLHQLSPDLAGQLGLEPESKGLLVLDIDQAGAKGDLRLYDLIEEIARTKVTSVADVSLALSQARTGESLLLKVRRSQNGKVQSQLVVLER